MLRKKLIASWDAKEQFFISNIGKVVNIIGLYQDKVEPKSMFDVMLLHFFGALNLELLWPYGDSNKGPLLLASRASKISEALSNLALPTGTYAQKEIETIIQDLKPGGKYKIIYPSEQDRRPALKFTAKSYSKPRSGVTSPNPSVGALPRSTIYASHNNRAFAWSCLAFSVATLVIGLTALVTHLRWPSSSSLQDSRRYGPFLLPTLILGAIALTCLGLAVCTGIKSYLEQIKIEEGKPAQKQID